MEHLALLAIDTSTEYCSVAVCLPIDHALPDDVGTAAPDLTISVDPAAGLRFVGIERNTGAISSTYILPAVDTALRAAGITLADCRAIAFGAGPGSFTGLRTATGIVQGLAFGAGLTVVPINTLMACAESTRLHGGLRTPRVVVAVDARMAECYWEAFEWSASAGEWLVQSATRVGPPASVVAPWAVGEPYGLVGNATSVLGDAVAAAPSAAWTDASARPSGAAIASIGWRALAAGLAYPPARAQPEYIRDKVALTTVERAIEHQRKKAAAARAPAPATGTTVAPALVTTNDVAAVLPVPGMP